MADAVFTSDRPLLVRPTLLVAYGGWNDAGTAATTAVQYAAEQASAKTFASIDGDEFFDFTMQRPIVRLDDHQIRNLEWPGYEFSAAEGGSFVFSTGPEPHLRWKRFVADVVALARELQVERVALLGSFLAQVVYSDPVPITGFASDRAELERLGIPTTSYQGPTGIVGALADGLRRADFPVISIWAAVPHYIAATPNPRAALALLLKLREWTSLPVDLGPIEAAATTFQGKLLEAVEGDSALANYVRGLRKDEPSH